MKKITIGLFIDTFFPMIDGVVMVVDNYAKELSKYANVIVFAPKIPHQKFNDSKFSYKVVRCMSVNVPIIDYSLPIPKLDIRFMKELHKYKFDIIHIHSPATLGHLGMQIAKKNNIILIGTMHSQYKQDFLRITKNEIISNMLTKGIIKIYNACDECWAVNSEVGRIFYEEYHYKKMPKIMNNATEMLPVKDVTKAKKHINKIHNIKEKEHVFLFVGRINKLKNIFFIIDALNIIKDKIQFKMLFVGSGQDEKELRDYIDKLELNDKIILCGRVTNRELLAEYYARSDLFLFPSMYDASSIVQIEAASQKTPTLFLEDSATSCNIKNKVNGYISRNNYKEYANMILEIINNKKEYKKVCENAFKDIYVTWSKSAKKVYETYLKMLNKRG